MRTLPFIALLLALATPTAAQIQPGPNISPSGIPFTYSPRFGYLGPPAAFVPGPPPAPRYRRGSMPIFPMPRAEIVEPPRVALTVAPAMPDQPRNAVHNGSLMIMFTNAATGDLVINYALPRPDLIGLVGPGTTLVRGRWSGDVFVGEARVFSRYCGAVPYPVRGSVDQTNALMLFGPAPQFDTACNIIGFDINSRHAVLRFEPEGPQ